MDLWRRLFLSFSTLIVCGGAQALAANDCEIRSLPNAQISSRSRAIHFANGREIILVGHRHVNRQYNLKLNSLTRKSQAEVSNARFVTELQEMLNDDSLAVKHAGQDLKFLKEFLQQRPDIQFVGVEGTQLTVQENVSWYQGLQSRYFSQLSRRNLPVSVDHQNAILLVAGAATYLSIVEPGRLRGRPLAGVESENESNIHDEALDEFDQAADALKAQAKGDKVFLKMISETYTQFQQAYPTYDPILHDPKYIAEVRKNIPAKYAELGMKWFKAGLKEMAAMKDRDREIAKNLIERNETGLLLFGHGHLDSVALMLKESCLKSSPSKPGAAPLSMETQAVQ